MKKIMWTALVTISSAVATAAAFKASTWLWQRLENEPPPPRPKWAKLLVGPMRKGIGKSLHAPVS
jgi:hypothetical protein